MRWKIKRGEQNERGRIILETPSGMISHGDLTAITCALSDLEKAMDGDVTLE